MSEPLVVAIMLTKDRPEMAARAVQCFYAQTYQRKRLIVWDTSVHCERSNYEIFSPESCQVIAPDVDQEACASMSVGLLRNAANKYGAHHYGPSSERCDILCHWDDDDWSHPNRIAEQVALLQASGAEAVGYHSMYFYRAGWEFPRPYCDDCAALGREALCPRHMAAVYLYNGSGGYPYGYVIGTSLCYWRSVWEKRPFLDVPESSDSKFCNGTDPEGRYLHEPLRTASVNAAIPGEPRMIARIHPDSMQYKAGYRNRLDIPPWSLVTDAATIEHVRKVMEL
jgi:hypothetical protein